MAHAFVALSNRGQHSDTEFAGQSLHHIAAPSRFS